MPEFTVRIEADELADPRFGDLDDLLRELQAQPCVRRPTVSGDLGLGTLAMVVAVEDYDEDTARDHAFLVLSRALVATRRTASVARLLPVLGAA
jgi:hypothetical protein